MKNTTASLMLVAALSGLIFSSSAEAKRFGNVSVAPACRGDFIDNGGNQWENTGYYGCSVTIHLLVTPNPGSGGGTAPIEFNSPLDALSDPRVPASVKASIANEFLPRYLDFQNDLNRLNAQKISSKAKEVAFQEIIREYSRDEIFLKVAKLKVEYKAKSKAK